jgi:hypothetical protein
MSEKWEYKIVYVDAERWTSTGLPGDLNENFDTWGRGLGVGGNRGYRPQELGLWRLHGWDRSLLQEASVSRKGPRVKLR